jgi:hypothetical protein
MIPKSGATALAAFLRHRVEPNRVSLIGVPLFIDFIVEKF